MFSSRFVSMTVWISAEHYSQVHCNKVECIQEPCSDKHCSQVHCSKKTCSNKTKCLFSAVLDIAVPLNSVSYNADTAAKYTAFMSTAVI